MELLTGRELEIAQLISTTGLSNKGVARRLDIAEGTVKVHLHNIFRKLNIGNRAMLVAIVTRADGN
jgi:two-component system nitrate/nitrite response regulator NarL